MQKTVRPGMRRRKQEMFRATKILLALAIIACAILISMPAQANTTWNFANTIDTRFSWGPGYNQTSAEQQFTLWAWGIPTGTGTTATFQQAGGNNPRWAYNGSGGPVGLISYSVDDANDTAYKNRNDTIGSQFTYNVTGGDLVSQPLDDYKGAQPMQGQLYYVPNGNWLVSLLNSPNGTTAQSYQASAVVRWTAAVEGDYDVTATWTGRKLSGTESVPVALYANGISQFTGNPLVANGSAPVSWTGIVHLLAGQTIDDTLLPGTNGNDYIQMDLVVTSQDVPEPGAFLMLGMSLVGLAGFKLRRR
jgi:hypothetical protein